MTKQRFLADVMRFVPRGETICISVTEPFYHWQPLATRSGDRPDDASGLPRKTEEIQTAKAAWITTSH